MEAFEFFIPQNIMVGAGTMAKLPECAKKLGGSHAMLISGPTLRKMGIVDKAADYLKEAGMKVDIFTDVEANPSVTTVEKATEAFKEAGADFIVALGGGSISWRIHCFHLAATPKKRFVTLPRNRALSMQINRTVRISASYRTEIMLPLLNSIPDSLRNLVIS